MSRQQQHNDTQGREDGRMGNRASRRGLLATIGAFLAGGFGLFAQPAPARADDDWDDDAWEGGWDDDWDDDDDWYFGGGYYPNGYYYADDDWDDDGWDDDWDDDDWDD